MQPKLAPGAVAYYAALAKRGQQVFHVSPWTRPVAFNFDFAIDYTPARTGYRARR